MSWLLTGNSPTVDRLVFAGIAALLCVAICYALYHALLRSRVEYGEMHPGNLRRGLWAWFFLLLTLECLYFFRESVHFPAGWVLLLPAVAAVFFVLATRIRV
jgi:hypothetical protein